ncbi:MAG TPA: type II toxin-antitoxin system VapC family toxin [Vicinamibacterales bacterium]|jgi:PIN domain nuclease of toxin-antitoxin system
MNVLLDTCALVALAGGTLPDPAARVLQRAPEAYVSAVSAWEVAIKVAGGRLRLLEPPLHWFHGLVERYELREVALDANVACAAAALPLLHRDPFDRVLVALAQAHGLTILTSDENIRKYPSVRTLW